jgi:hypothetical protein
MGQKNSTQTVRSDVDPWTRDKRGEVYNQAQEAFSQPYQSYGGERVAGFNQDQQNAFQGVRDIGANGVGFGQLGQAGDLARQAGAYNPNQVSAGPRSGIREVGLTPEMQAQAAALSRGDVRDVSAQQVTGQGVDQAGALSTMQQFQQAQGRSGVGNVTAGSFLDGNIQAYMNPYTDQVVNAQAADVDRMRQMQQQQNAAAMSKAGAFGGTRHGLVEAETNRAALEVGGRQSAELRARGFDTASGILAGDQNRAMQAGMSNQGADLSVAGMGAQIGSQFGLADQDAVNRARLANQGANLQAGMANQGMDFNVGNLNTQNQQQANMANAAMGFQAQLANQGMDLAYSQQGMQAQLANQGAGLTANQQRMGAAGLLGQFGAQEQDMAYRNANALNIAGTQQQQNQQMRNDADYQEFMRQQNWGRENAAGLAGIFQGMPYGTTTTTPMTQNRTAGVLGGAASGAGIGNMIVPGIGAGVGAGIGGLLGAF